MPGRCGSAPGPSGRPPGLLRWLADLLIRGPDAPFVLAELNDALERDLASGMSPWRARRRLAWNVLASALSVGRARWHRRVAAPGRDPRLAPPATLQGAIRAPQPHVPWLDVKLGLRMLVKHPGLTCVAAFALAIGIPVGLAPMHLVSAVEAHLPVDEGARIRALRYWNAGTSRVEPTTLPDLRRWSEALATFDALGAARGGAYNVDVQESLSPPVPGAEVTASTFEILRVPPLLGRTLGPADEVAGAPEVVVIGFDLWQSRLAGDPGVIGRSVRLGGVSHTVVGVMPQGFRFPVNQELWLPLRQQPGGAASGEGPRLAIFGRLADGASPEEAQAEVAALGPRADLGPRDGRLLPEVVPFPFLYLQFPRGGVRTAEPGFYLIQLLALLLLGVACTNVGLLLFARTATRSAELAMRTALGASRWRIVSQLFTESLVLAVLAAGAGLLLIDQLSRLLLSGALGTVDLLALLPWWIDPGVTLQTVLWALGLAVISAVVAGVVPALKVTGKGLQRSMQQAGTGRGTIRFGGVSAALVVADVAVAVAAVAVVVTLSERLIETLVAEDAVGIPADEFLAVDLGITRLDPSVVAADPTELAARLGATRQALVERLEAEPGVRAVAVASVLPRMDHPIRWAEVDREDPPDGRPGHQIRVARVDPGFFDALDQPILAGRGFDSIALEDGSAVIVNTTFVEQVLGGRNPIGRRVRYRSWNEDPGLWNGESGPSYEIVGVVGRLGMHVLSPDGDAGLYHPLAPGQVHPVRLGIHLAGDPASFTPRLRELVTEVDPLAFVENPRTLDTVFEGDWYIVAAITLGFVLLVGVLLALAASGTYAILSFTVAERTREIGIRAALGARRSDIALTVARRALAQLGGGVLLGMCLGSVLQDDPGAVQRALVTLVPGVAVLVLVGLVACAAPTLRALRVSPTEALRDGG